MCVFLYHLLWASAYHSALHEVKQLIRIYLEGWILKVKI